MEYDEIIKRSRDILSDIVIKTNLIEAKLKSVISQYVDSDKSFFVTEVLLNNLVMSLSSKAKALRYIVKTESLTLKKDFVKSLFIVMSKRNMIAHSDSLLSPDVIDVDVDVDWNPDGVIHSVVYEFGQPFVSTISDGEVKIDDIEKVYKDFEKYFIICNDGLKDIAKQLKFELNEDPEGI